MKKLKKIKLSNIENSQLEKEQLINLRGGDCGYGDPCTKACGDDCMGAGSFITNGASLNHNHDNWYWK